MHMFSISADQLVTALYQGVIINVEKKTFSSTCYCNPDLILINFVSQLFYDLVKCHQYIINIG